MKSNSIHKGKLRNASLGGMEFNLKFMQYQEEMQVEKKKSGKILGKGAGALQGAYSFPVKEIFHALYSCSMSS